MRLHDESIVPEALQETVAMEDWYRDQLSAVMQRFFTVARSQSGSVVHTQVEKIHELIRTRPFDELTSADFFSEIGFDDLEEAMQPPAQLVTVVQQVTPGITSDIRALRSAMEIIIHADEDTATYRSSIERGVIETAVKQALKKRGIDVPEHKRLHDHTDTEIIQEAERISGIVHDRVKELLQF